MKFQYYDLGHLNGGEIVEVILSGNAANVRLMDSSNYSNFKNGRQHTHIMVVTQKDPLLEFQFQGRAIGTLLLI